MVIVVHINHVNHNLIKDRVRLVVMVSYTLSIVLICTMVTNYLYHKLIEGRAWLVVKVMRTWNIMACVQCRILSHFRFHAKLFLWNNGSQISYYNFL